MNLADRSEIDQLNEQAWSLRMASTRQAISVARKALENADRADYLGGKARSLQVLGQCLLRVGEFEEAGMRCAEALTIYQALNDRKGTADALNAIGNVHSALGDHHTAFTFYLRSIEIHQEMGNATSEAALWNNIGNLHAHLDDYESALEAHEKSLALKQKANEPVGAAISMNNIGNIHKHAGRFNEALKSYEECLKVVRQIGDHLIEAGALANLGAVHDELNDPRTAHDYHMKALALQRKIGNRHGEAECLLQIGRRLMKYPGEEQAVSYLQDGLTLAAQLNAKDLMIRAHQSLSEWFDKSGNPVEALRHYQRFHGLERELFDDRLAEKTKKLQILHQVEISRLRNIELEEANRFKSKLIEIAAHDLRAPLSGIRGYAELLLTQIDVTSPMYQAVEKMRSRADTMEHLLHELLESSLLESSQLKVELQDLDLARITHQVTETYRMTTEKKRQVIYVRTSPGCVVLADEQRVLQILDNLVSNAIKFSPVERKIWIVVQRHGAHVRWSIRDEGPGLTEDDKRRLFGRFERLSATPTAGESSTGLGLSIVKQLVELQGGRIWAESGGRNQGSTFTFELPAGTASVSSVRA